MAGTQTSQGRNNQDGITISKSILIVLNYKIKFLSVDRYFVLEDCPLQHLGFPRLACLDV